MRSSMTRKIEAAVATLAPDEPAVDTGYAWVFADSGRAPKLFRTRRRCVVARTGRRIVVWPVPQVRRPLVGTRPLLIAPLDQLEVMRLNRARVLAALRVHTTAGATVVLELTPRARGFGARLATAIESVPVVAGTFPAVATVAPAPTTAALAAPAITRGEVLKVVTDLRDGRLQADAARAWAVAVAGSPVAGADVTPADQTDIGDIVARLASDGPDPVEPVQLDAWITRLTAA